MTGGVLDIPDIMDGGIEFPDIELTGVYESAQKKVSRPLRFDTYARVKPLFGKELLVLKPNVGFSVVLGEDVQYFNMGAEARLNLGNVLIPYVSVNRDEGIWTNRAGFAFNLRLIELDLEASLQSQNLKDSFAMKGLGVTVGVRLGW